MGMIGLGWWFAVALDAPGLGSTNQLHLIFRLRFRFQKALNHLAAGSSGKFPFFCPLQSSQLWREGMERGGGSWRCFHHVYTWVRVS